MINAIFYRAFPTIVASALPVAADLIAHQIFFKKSNYPQFGRTLVGAVSLIGVCRYTKTSKVLALFIYCICKAWQIDWKTKPEETKEDDEEHDGRALSATPTQPNTPVTDKKAASSDDSTPGIPATQETTPIPAAVPASQNTTDRIQQLEKEAQQEFDVQKALLREMFPKAVKITVDVVITKFAHVKEDKETHEKIHVPERKASLKDLIFRFYTDQVFTFEKETVDGLKAGMTEKTDILEETSFIWIDLSFEKGTKSLTSYEYLPVSFLQTLTKKQTLLVIEETGQRFEIQFHQDGATMVKKKLGKLNSNTPIQSIMPKHYLATLSPAKPEMVEFYNSMSALLISSSVYLKPLNVEIGDKKLPDQLMKNP